ncbi:hypothetical protein Q4503_11150 [Colwellia sp. 6_MG-2023]|uniref:hypothetical protein n=1 Tax=Colwellia sp. 6_MG-2023 TaxID=3062676 RepID=UPI0026E19E5C|nr:hypothetical protein [Colwellia sp. 6_MG-2023]MDO6488261.1 hypothetical protein [Colwellia sp. 6_MG-2023]
MNNDNNQELANVSSAQESVISDAKNILASKQDVLMAIGQVQAFDFIQKLTTVGSLKSLSEIKESKAYKGLTYKNEKGELTTVGTWEECCKNFLGSSKSAIDEKLINLNAFGEEFFESAQRIGLGTRELRKLRQLPEESQQLVINSEEVDLGDKEAVKELIEDLNFKQVTEISALEAKVKEAESTVEAVRANSATKQKELDEVKEIEAKRRFSQEPWKHQTLDLAKGMLEARVLIEQGVNQLTEIFKQITDVDSPLDEKATNYCARSIFSEATNVNDLVYALTSEVSGLLSTTFKADLDAVDVLTELSENNE